MSINTNNRHSVILKKTFPSFFLLHKHTLDSLGNRVPPPHSLSPAGVCGVLNWFCDEHQVAKNQDQLRPQALEERSHMQLPL